MTRGSPSADDLRPSERSVCEMPALEEAAKEMKAALRLAWVDPTSLESHFKDNRIRRYERKPDRS
jgi:hypothetical protein